MEVLDSRRLIGPNVLWKRPGAVLEVALDASDPASELIDAWTAEARLVLAEVGWGAQGTATRVLPGGASLAISAPVDGLYAAIDVNELAWARAVARVQGLGEALADEDVERLRASIAKEANPALIALRAAANERGVTFLADDDAVSIGTGKGSRTFGLRDVPAPDAIDWSAIHDVPLCLVAGTNGKTTTARLLASIARAAELVPGLCTSDSVLVGDALVATGDRSDASGARLVLRDARVELAVLETGQRPLLRSGLAVERADVALITNVAGDAIGGWGTPDLGALTETMFVVRHAAERLVLDADDANLRARGKNADRPVTWLTLDPSGEPIADHLGQGGDACMYDGADLVFRSGEASERVVAVEEVPIALGGIARHNVANALGALGAAAALGLSWEAIAAGLRAFESTIEANPGRMNDLDLGGVRVLVDSASNVHAFEAVFELASRLPAGRRLVAFGSAADAPDAAIREMARIAWRSRPDLVIVEDGAEPPPGRARGDVPGLIEAELRDNGATDEALECAPSETAAVRRALQVAEAGDLVVVLTRGERDAVLGLVRELFGAGWEPGKALPDED